MGDQDYRFVAVIASDHDFVARDRQGRCTGKLFLHGFNDVMRAERFAVILPDMAVGRKTGL